MRLNDVVAEIVGEVTAGRAINRRQSIAGTISMPTASISPGSTALWPESISARAA
jgi:hypothetical protein